MYWQLGTQNQDTVLLDLAGRQGLLVAHMNLLVVQVMEGAHPTAAQELADTTRLFERSLDALRDGGAAPELHGEPVQLAAAKDSRVLAQISQVSQAWTAYQ